MQPDTRYAKSGDVHIAYQVFGEGPLNVVFAPPGFTNVEHWWDQPEVSRWLLRLASYARVVMFDKRGTGLSDRVADFPGPRPAHGRPSGGHGRHRNGTGGDSRHF
jgi:pimeloyl-ACP methyl ester carboxylesterase